MKRIIAGLIRTYQLVLSPFVGPTCRFHPTCSEYARESVLVHGIVQGGWLALARLARCHRWHSAGYDPVPRVSKH
jgi:putative membrane protein insertion efficiency factor